MKPAHLLPLSLLAASTHAATLSCRNTTLTSCLSAAGVPFAVPTSDTWDLAAATYNARLPYTPVAIAIPEADAHISAAVRCGAEHGVKVTPKSGGHSYASLGLGGEDGHLVVELDQMANVTLDVETGIATVGSGARLGYIAQEIYNLGKRGFSHGTCVGVGIAGHVLHGGYGMASHTHGLALDWVDSMTVVLANASIVSCSATESPDLFWAMLGAGSSFGIVTSFRLRTFAAPENVTWFSASLEWDGEASSAVAALEALETYTRDTMPRELNMRLAGGRAGASVEGVYYGEREGLDRALAPLWEVTNGSISRAETTGWIGALEHYSETGMGLNVSDPYDTTETFYSKSLTLKGLNGTAAANFVDYWINAAANVDRMWWFQLDLHGGAHSAIRAADTGVTSYAHRDKLYLIQFYDRAFFGGYPDDGFALLDGWVDATTEGMGRDEWGMYLNYADARMERAEAEEAYWGVNVQRLREVKASVDAGDLFYNPISVEPATA